MGHDHQQSSSSGAVIAIVVAVLLVGIVGLLAVAGAGLLLVRGSKMQQAVAIESQMVAEVHRAKSEEQRAVAEVHLAEAEIQQAVSQLQRAATQIQQSSVGAIPDPRLNFVVTLDREGNASVDGEGIGLDELRSRLAKLKDETSNAFSVQINADPECPVKLLIPVLDVCEEVGDIDFSIASSSSSDSTSDEDDTPSLTRKQSGFPLFLR